MGKIVSISYDELVAENKKRREHFGLDNLKKTRIQSIKSNKDDFVICIFNVGLQQESTYPLESFIKAYMTYKDIYFTNITTSEFKDVFQYKSRDARLNAEKKGNKTVNTTIKKDTRRLLPVILQHIGETERLLNEINSKQTTDRSDGITVMQLASMCLQEIRKGNGDKHILLQNEDEGNGLHTCFNGIREFDLTDPYEFTSSDCHDNNDLTKCIMIS